MELDVITQVRQIYSECRDIGRTAKVSKLSQDEVRQILSSVSYRQINDDAKRIDEI